MSIVQTTIALLSPEAAAGHQAGLVALLQDAVDSGASVGFLPPLDASEAAAYWDGVVQAMRAGSRLLLIARDAAAGDVGIAAGVVGTVQLDLAMQPNARHRAEVAKLMVHRSARRHGIGRTLMLAVEEHARRIGRTTLVLDTRQGDPSEALYRSVGWQVAGAIPRYAESADGRLHATAFYWKLLDSA